MSHFVDALQQEAAEAIARMREAAIEARRLHARAELMRHMLTTARKVKDKPKAEAVETVVREWMDAWNLGRSDWPHIAREMDAFTEAFHDYANAPSDANDARVAASAEALDAALSREGTSIAEQMAFRSQCAHGWWELVAPTPADLPGRKPRPSMPALRSDAPFWETGCADFCR
ncbi:MAG TPA: hypothetical protein VGN82_21490 [Bosea sp. (in: a-proteobacteria)]|jgi:hypothetical protein|uniref:hypothetical protein n=1 Tax=Bosea sp. (in: a-proteobacteria) TaxID=1871050 RepID=UPI002E145FD7|nr:hypothetical protein [Bosea sp. (in: a-proteobacteria)]